MGIETVNLGTYANDGTGDDLRTAFEKVIGNFDYLDLIKVEEGENLGLNQPNTHGVYAGVDGVTLQFKSIKQGDNVVITHDGSTITIRPKDSINAVEEDPNPKLGGNLDTAGYNIFSEDLPLDIYVHNNLLSLYNYNTDTGDFLPLSLNGLQLLGNNFNSPGTSFLSTYIGDALNIVSDLDLTLTSTNGTIYLTAPVEANSSITAADFFGPLTGNVTGNTTGTHTGPVFGAVTGNVTGNLTGDVTGTLFGNVQGQVSDISNHFLRDLGDVTSNPPGVGNFLGWNGSSWTPVALDPGVTQILAGTNVIISPIGGTGVVTISASMNLDALTDVQISSPAAEQVLKYDGVKWVNATTPTPVAALNDLTDVVITTPATNQILQYNGTQWTNTTFNLEQSILDFDLGVIGANITSPLQLLFQALNVDFDTFDNPAGYNIDLGTIGGGAGPTEWTSGPVDGGSPTTTSFTYYIDNGGPTTVSFSAIADGGNVFGLSVDGGSPGGSPSLFVDGGGPITSPSITVDGGSSA